MKMDVRILEATRAMELYITATPTEASLAGEGREIFESIRTLLLEKGAWICQERIFAPPRDLPVLREQRREAYGALCDSVEPVCLAAGDAGGMMPGVQVHAVRTASAPRILAAGDTRARLFQLNGCRWLTAGGLRAPEAGEAKAQARSSFEKAEHLLRQAGADLRNVARTWIFMDDILSWYDGFNQVRNGLFRERGILGPVADGRVPASTGIGVSPADGARCSLDLFAVIGPDGSVQRYGAAGKQRSAYEYGSAFARAAVAVTPAGRTVFISGTAAIDAGGATCHLDDPAGQIRMTIENVQAVLRQLSVEPDDVVQAIAYCAGPEVREIFAERYRPELPWPWLTMIGDICRPDLLFEIEVAACPHAKVLVAGPV
jgi:enamine deaminase RidA (YjgF/YER057c/UK114 family)